MRTVFAMMLFAAALTLAGCATMTQSREEVAATQRRYLGIQCRELADDCYMAILLDRPNRLSRWLIR